MDCYTVKAVDHYDMERTQDGMWVMYDDAQSAIATAVAAERERILERGAEYVAHMLQVGDKAVALRGFLLTLEVGA